MLTRARITGYKSLRDVEVPLSRVTLVFGANSAGKSNLLDALALLSRMTTMPTLDAAFEAHRGARMEAFSFGNDGIEDLMRREYARFTMAVDVLLSEDVVERVERQISQAREGLPDQGTV